MSPTINASLVPVVVVWNVATVVALEVAAITEAPVDTSGFKTPVVKAQ